MFEVLITPSAEVDIQRNFHWWYENRSQDQAIRWYQSIHESITTLKKFPERCPTAPEAELLGIPIRQLSFGIGSHPTHRIVFLIRAELVIILRVRHSSQQSLSDSDLG